MFISKKASEYKAHIFIPLWVLLWKYSLSRANQYCHTFWEVFGGVFVFLMLFLVHQTKTIDKHTEIYTNENNNTVTRVYYTPYNNFTRRLMTRVEAYLTLNDSGVLPKRKWDFESIAFPINKDILNISNDIALNDGSPDLEYDINVISGEEKNILNTAFNGFFRSITPKEEIAPPYLGTLQWAIDKSFIERLTDQEIGQDVMMISIPKYISEELRTLHKFMTLCTIVAPLPFFLVHSSKLIMERRSGLRACSRFINFYASPNFSMVVLGRNLASTTCISTIIESMVVLGRNPTSTTCISTIIERCSKANIIFYWTARDNISVNYADLMLSCTGSIPTNTPLLTPSRNTDVMLYYYEELMKLSGICSDVLRFSYIVETSLLGILYSIPVIIILKMTAAPILPHSNFFIICFTIVLHFVNTMSLTFVTTALSQDYHHADGIGFLLYMSTFILDFLWYSYKDHLFMLYVVCCFLPHAPMYLFWDEVLYLERMGVGTQFSNVYKCHSDNAMSVSRVWLFFYIQLALITTLAWYLDLVRPGYYGVSKKWNFMFQKTYWCFKNKRRILQIPSKTKRDYKYFEKGPKHAEIAIQVLNVSKVEQSYWGFARIFAVAAWNLDMCPENGNGLALLQQAPRLLLDLNLANHAHLENSYLVFKQKGTKAHDVSALNSVTFDCYKGEVTVVLGTNGAGKTTLMHIVAGMFSATSGTVYVNGIDVANKIIELREDVGLCMQQNVCFRFLTVKENILFFKKLRRNPKEGFTVEQLMKKLKLTSVADLYSTQLSTGNLRCLQVACVLAGDADVLVLDEATTGMDMDVRHRLWDLIMVLRGNKTVLMTTSCLEEANALADRIVILNNGLLKCHGTPTFLKHAIGTSFNLSITIKDSTRLLHLKEMVDKIIPELKCKIHDMTRMTFSLPCKEFRKFPELFQALEKKKEEFGIMMMDVGMFMEEVFSKFIEEVELDHYSINTSTSYLNYRTERIVGVKLTLTQMKMLQRRVYDFFMMRKYQFLCLHIIVPVLCLLIVTLTSNYSLRHDRIFSNIPFHAEVTKLVYNVGPFKRRGLFDGVHKYPGVEPVYALDIDREFSGPSSGYMNRKTVGLKIADNYTKIFHPPDPRSTSESVNMYSNIYMSIFMPYLNNTIRTTYEPLSRTDAANIKHTKCIYLCMKWTSWVTFLAILPLTPIIILCIIELNCGIRDNHMMAGCTPIVHWGSKLLVHMAIFVLIILLPVILIAVLLDFDKTFAQAKFLGSVFLLLLMFGLAFLSHLYFMSFILNENFAISQIYIISMVFGVFLPILLAVLESAWNTSVFIAIPYFILMAVGRINPMFPFGVGLGRLTLQARRNAYCHLNKRLCPNLVLKDESFNSKVCCESTFLEPFPYLVSYDTGLIDIINLVLNFIIFATLVILLENRIPQYLYEQFTMTYYKNPAQAFQDQTVVREKDYVQKAIRNRKFDADVLLVDDVHKDHRHEAKENTLNAVRGISFATKLGQCLAILGPQASGKTSLLNMLAGNLDMTRGNARIEGIHIRDDRMKYIHKISLSSSAGGMDGFMTGHENLMFIAKMKGFPENMAYKLSHMALRYMGLKANEILVSKYSSGLLRRLALCSTLVLAPKVAFLDEPLREIDASTKPLVAKALHRLMLEPAALIVAESSVDWRILQPVFTRIAIMSKGQFAAIGPAEEILESVAKGFTAMIKLTMVTAYRADREHMFDDTDDEESSDSDETEEKKIPTEKSMMHAHRVNDFKKEFLNVFNTSKIIGEHLTVIFFHIDDENKTQLYSDMFTKLQKLKEKYEDVMEDYYLSATTIEDIFWRLEHDRDPENVIETIPPKKT